MYITQNVFFKRGIASHEFKLGHVIMTTPLSGMVCNP